MVMLVPQLLPLPYHHYCCCCCSCTTTSVSQLLLLLPLLLLFLLLFHLNASPNYRGTSVTASLRYLQFRWCQESRHNDVQQTMITCDACQRPYREHRQSFDHLLITAGFGLSWAHNKTSSRPSDGAGQR